MFEFQKSNFSAIDKHASSEKCKVGGLSWRLVIDRSINEDQSDTELLTIYLLVSIVFYWWHIPNCFVHHLISLPWFYPHFSVKENRNYGVVTLELILQYYLKKRALRIIVKVKYYNFEEIHAVAFVFSKCRIAIYWFRNVESVSIILEIESLYSALKDNWGLDFMRWDEIVNPEKGYIKNDTVKIRVCEINYTIDTM